MQYMDMKSIRIQMLEDVVELVQRNAQLREAVKQSRSGMSIYAGDIEHRRFYEAQVRAMNGNTRKQCRIAHLEGVKLSGLLDARQQEPEGRIGLVVLMCCGFAGGNVIRGGEGVEESVYRCSTAFSCIGNMELPTLSSAVYLHLPGLLCLRGEDENLDFLSHAHRVKWDLLGYTSQELRRWVNRKILCEWPDDRERNVILQEQEDETGESMAFLQKMIEDIICFGICEGVTVMIFDLKQFAFSGFDQERLEHIIRIALKKYPDSFRAVYLVH